MQIVSPINSSAIIGMMHNNQSTMAIFLFFLFALASTLPSVPAQTNLFAVHWGASVCQANTVKRCARTKTPTEFTIHGLWPQTSGTCRVFLQPGDLNSVMRGQLANVWPNVYDFGVDNPTSYYFKFWENEWKKHGCFSGLTATEYFQRSLNLNTAMGTLRQNLISEECRPGQWCNLADLLTKYDTMYPNRLPRIVCTTSRSGTNQIQEFRFRVSAAGALVTLGGYRTQNCNAEAYWPMPSLKEALPEALLISQVI